MLPPVLYNKTQKTIDFWSAFVYDTNRCVRII